MTRLTSSPALLVLAALLTTTGCGDQATATGPVPGAPPTVFSISPDTMQSASVVNVSGVNFSSSLGNLSAEVNGHPAAIGEATRTQLFFTAPSSRALGCEPAGPATLTVSVDGRPSSTEVPLRTAIPVDLEADQSMRVVDEARVPCHRVPARETRYLMSVFNPDPAAGPVSFQFRGEPVGGEGSAAASVRSADGADAAAAGSAAAASRDSGGGLTARERLRRKLVRPDGSLDVSALPDGSETPFPVDIQELVRQKRAHQRVLANNLSFAREHLPALTSGTGSDVRTGARSGDAPPVGKAAPPRQGDVRNFRIPILGVQDLCSTYQVREARAVYVGENVVVFEDTSAPLAGEMDGTWREFGEEYDEVMHPLITENFGDPMAYDSQLDQDGRVYMLFSPLVNFFSSAAGFVWPGDFAPPSACASSDQAEIFYSGVPTRSGSGFGGDTPQAFYWSMRSVVMHEMKHIVSIAERLARDATELEELWLEEGTAMLAEEIYARKVYGYDQLGNTGYRESLYCELRPTNPDCRGLPQVMFAHWFLQYIYHLGIDQFTPLGPTSSSDQSFYGSAWNLVRWTIDHSSRDEDELLSDLTQSGSLSGTENLAAQAGMSWERIVGYWTMTQATDDHPDFNPERDELKLPSWNTRAIWNGLNEDLFFIFVTNRPLNVHGVRPGTFEVQNNGLRGGSASILEVDGRTDILGIGSTSPAQILKIQGPNGGAPPDQLRTVIVRMQ